MALVITLILLSVITFLSVTFLLVSRRERGQVTLVSNQSDADLGVATALERAKAEVVARMMPMTNILDFDLMVSTNIDMLTNVNLPTFAQLRRDPRAPVRMDDNLGSRFFYLDLNRNHQFESNINGMIGDPEWIGVTEHIGDKHSGENRFIYRYAYLIQPVGKELDLNFIHNQSKGSHEPAWPANIEGFLRNQGHGSWEINMAAFLRDLNTNAWADNISYVYEPAITMPSSGTSFEDAQDLLRWHYSGDYHNLNSVAGYFHNQATNGFVNDHFDTYGDGPVSTGPYLYPAIDDDVVTRPWPGADLTNYTKNVFFHINDWFDTQKTGSNYSKAFLAQTLYGRLTNVMAQPDEYNRYTYYRLLAQVGTDSVPQRDTNVLHLNYINLPLRSGTASDTNLVRANYTYTNYYPWNSFADTTNNSAVMFFTNVANRLLDAQWNDYNSNTVVISNMTQLPIDQYSPSIHRFLQVAANIYDATYQDYYWNRARFGEQPPTIFQPIFGINQATTNKQIEIVNYARHNDDSFITAGLLARVYERSDPALTNILANTNLNIAIYGVPLILGARKGLPNINEITLQSYVQVERKIQITQPFPDALPRIFQTNQMFIMGISNVLGLEVWNSYYQRYSNSLRMVVKGQSVFTLTNEFGNMVLRQTNDIPNLFTNIPGINGGKFAVYYPMTSVPLVDSVYYQKSNGFYRPHFGLLYPNSGFDVTPGFPTLNFGMNITNRLVCYLVATNITPNRIIDFISLDNLVAHVDINSDLLKTDLSTGVAVFGDNTIDDSVWWDPARLNGSTNTAIPTVGVNNQIRASLGEPPDAGNWRDYGAAPNDNKKEGIDGFRFRLGLTPLYHTENFSTNIPDSFQAPFSPMRKMFRYTSWQVNDPLVHYLTSHYCVSNSVPVVMMPPITAADPRNDATGRGGNLGKTNGFYSPWGGSQYTPDPYGGAAFDLTLKDPMVRQSDDWDFPTNKFASIGWLGRVHRGTPWQTIYFKSTVPDLASMAIWYNVSRNQAYRMNPTNDWALADMFTVAPHPNATRGLLSVNQTNLAAWSAVLSGVMVLSNSIPDSKTNLLKLQNAPVYDDVQILPGANYGLYDQSPIHQIVGAINEVRTNEPKRVFTRVSQLLAVPELTIASPFLNTGNANQLKFGIGDEAYERIPQQILSLLKVGEPRFVIYAYGQSLRPAPRSITFGSDPALMRICTNYQVVGEAATRTVIRVENQSDDPEELVPRVVTESFNILPTE